MTANPPTWLPERLLRFWHATPLQILRSLIRGEAEGEPWDGQIAVGCVVRNRTLEPGWWGTDYVEVALHPEQFSCFWADWGKRGEACIDSLLNQRPADVTAAALQVLQNCPDPTDGCLYYFNPSIVTPSWAARLVHRVTIGHHAFYADL